MKLVTISISHYVEKVKWALHRAALSYTEESHIPGLHALITLWHTQGRHRATPVLIDGDQVIPDSTAIFAHLTTKYGQKWLYAPADALELEERFDRNIGPHTRRFIYQQLFDSGLSVADIFAQDVVPAWQKALLPLVAPVIKEGMIRDMAIHPLAAENSRITFEKEFEFVADRLRDGRPYLCGDQLSAADLAFAALSAPVILPKGYGARLPDPDDAGPEAKAVIEKYRATPAGQFVLRLYREERQKPAKNY